MFKLKSIKVFSFITILTIVLFIIVATVLIVTINIYMKKYAYEDAVSKSQIILDKNLATHSFYSQVLKPDLFHYFAEIDVEPEFDPVWMSSTYAIREINDFFYRLRNGNEDYYYKEAAVNARTEGNEADSYERDFLYQLSMDETLTDKSKIRYFEGKPFLTILRRGEQMEDSCLQCHSEPEFAPQGLVDIYGPDRSFGRKSGEIISAISIRIPLAAAYRSANNISIMLSMVLIFSFGVFIAILLFANRQMIFKPISDIRKTASEIANDNSKLGEQIQSKSGKEINDLADSFNKMSVTLRDGRDNLEKKVKERSTELTIANELLAEDIKNRKEVEEQLRLEKIRVEQINKELEREIEERKKVEKYIRSLAYHDNLTGLPNRILFYDRIGIVIADSKRNNKKFAVLLFDIDNFKKINDTMGHDKGDELLRCIAGTLNTTLRESDTSARLGGDEFIVLINNIKSEKDAFRVAAKISESLKDVSKKNKECNFIITVSIGISVYPDDGDDVNTLIKNADIAMYNVKRSGKDFYRRFNSKMIDEITS